MRTLLVLLFLATGLVSCLHEDLWEEIKEDAEADWKAIKESFSDGMDNLEKEVKEDWEVVKDVAKEDWKMAKEDWKMVKEEAKEDWNKLDLDWNKLALSDSEVLPGESAESEEAERKEERMYTQDYIDEFERYLIKVESVKNPIVTEDASVIKCSKLCFVSQSSDKQEEEEECNKGCKSQKGEFKEMQEKFQKTEPSLLLGSALDRCWEGCQSRPQCIDGCNVMRTLQISQLKREKEALQDMTAKDAEVEKKEEEFKKEADDKEQELKKAGNVQESDFVIDSTGGGIEQPHVWTYVLWRPSFSAVGLPSLSQEDAQESYAQMVQLIQSMMGGWETSANEVVVGDELPRIIGEDGSASIRRRGGWLDDRMQLKLPEDTAAASFRRSEGDGSFYSRLTQSLGNVKEQVQNTFRAPGFQQDLYYILVGLSGFLLITTALNSVFSKREERANVEDHYFLNGKTAGAKLPTYEDCIKADRELVMDITEQESYTKKNLSLPTFVVLEPVSAANISEPASVHTSNKHEEEKDENVA